MTQETAFYLAIGAVVALLATSCGFSIYDLIRFRRATKRVGL